MGRSNHSMLRFQGRCFSAGRSSERLRTASGSHPAHRLRLGETRQPGQMGFSPSRGLSPQATRQLDVGGLSPFRRATRWPASYLQVGSRSNWQGLQDARGELFLKKIAESGERFLDSMTDRSSKRSGPSQGAWVWRRNGRYPVGIGLGRSLHAVNRTARSNRNGRGRGRFPMESTEKGRGTFAWLTAMGEPRLWIPRRGIPPLPMALVIEQGSRSQTIAR